MWVPDDEVLFARFTVPRPHDVLPTLITHSWHLLARLQHNAVEHNCLEVDRCLRPAFALILLFLQNKDGNVGKGFNSEEWCNVLEEIIKAARRSWAEAYPNTPFSECIFMYDNPGFHNLDVGQKAHLLKPGKLLDSLDQLQQPPRYSGDMMQCIEHVHSWICSAWFKQRFREGEPTNNADREAQLSSLFYELVTPESVRKNVDKLVRLLNYMVEKNDGGYAPPRLV